MSQDVLNNRRDPDCGESQILEIVQIIDKTLEGACLGMRVWDEKHNKTQLESSTIVIEILTSGSTSICEGKAVCQKTFGDKN
jgi:hypothetical protein